jgi:hypothetical protein
MSKISTNYESSSLLLDESLTDPLLPLHAEEEANRCTLDPIQEEDVTNSQLNGSLSDYFYYYQNYQGSLPNIRRILASTWFGFTGRAIWSQNVLSVLIFLLYPQQPERVGYITAAMGLSQVLTTMVTNCCLSPLWRRDNLLRLAALVGFGAIGVTVYALQVKLEWIWLLGGLSGWGVMWGIIDVALPSLFADSLPETEQVMYYTRASRVVRSSNVLGPLVGIGIFYIYLQDEWNISNCAITMTIGLGFCLPMVLLLCCLRDVSVDELDFPDEIRLDDILLGTDDVDQTCKLDVGENIGNVTEETAAITALLYSMQDLEEDGSDEQSLTVCGCCRQSFVVPTLITIGSILSGIASGISIRYFPVFFVSELHLSPSFVQALYIITPLGQATVKYAAQGLARACGASWVTVMLQWTFVAVFCSMLYSYQQGMSVWIVLFLYLGQAFLMNSTTALTQSTLLSTIPEKDLPKWTIAETLQLMLWSLGAGGGGYLVGTQGLMTCFYTTAGLQLLASLPLVFLCCVGPSQEKVNSVLFPSSPQHSSMGGHPFTSLHDPAEELSNGGTYFEDSREMQENSVGSSSGVFFDCQSCVGEQSRDTSIGATTEMVAQYDVARRCCLYDSDIPAHVPAWTSAATIPSNYVKICHGNRKKAQNMWGATQQWRRDGLVWKIHTLPNPYYLRIKDAYPHCVHGFSKDGYPVIYEQPGKMKLKQLFREGCTISDMTRWYAFFMEYLSNCVHAPPSDNGEGSTEHSWGFVVVMDMRGAGISLLSSDVLSYLKQAGDINSAHFPLSMKQSFLVHAGSVVANVWSGVRKVLPESVHAEVFKSPTSLLEYIDQDQIPPEYGGTSPYALGQHPDEVALRSLAESLST